MKHTTPAFLTWFGLVFMLAGAITLNTDFGRTVFNADEKSILHVMVISLWLIVPECIQRIMNKDKQFYLDRLKSYFFVFSTILFTIFDILLLVNFL